MTDEIGLFEAMYTQRAIRYLKPDPVPDELITRIIEAGTQAPSGGNRQPWKFIVIQDSELKRRIGELYRTVFGGHVPGAQGAMLASSVHLEEHIHEAPDDRLPPRRHHACQARHQTAQRTGDALAHDRARPSARFGIGAHIMIAAQATHVDFQDVGFGLVIIPPNVRKNTLSGQHPTRMA